MGRPSGLTGQERDTAAKAGFCRHRSPPCCCCHHCRHLFELKWVERELSRVCSVYQQTRGLHNAHAREGEAGRCERGSR